MAVAPLGVPDLSVVTNTLLSMLETYLNSIGFTAATLSGVMPDAVRNLSGCQLTFSLFHVTEDKFQRNSPLLNRRAQTIPFQPMSLNLYYLLTTFSERDYVTEQQAMSHAMQFFYQTPIVKTQISLPGINPAVNEEFVLSMEMESSDELSRLWQAVTVPFRMSVVYRVSVVLLTPPATPSLAKQVTTVQLSANPALFPYTSSGEVTGTMAAHSFATPSSTTANPEIVSVDYSPGVVPLGDRFYLFGSNLNTGTSSRVFLIMSDGSEVDITANWKVAEPDPNHPNFQTSSRITLDLPATVGALPAQAPPPGIYQLRAGSNNPPDPSTNRSNSAPFSVAARIGVSIAPPSPPILAATAGTYTLNGDGFMAQRTQVLLDTVALSENLGGAPADGQFTVVSAQQITFRAPAGAALGRYTVRVRVNGVESPPSWWIVI
jgi:Pvc16 N-terminal domain